MKLIQRVPLAEKEKREVIGRWSWSCMAEM